MTKLKLIGDFVHRQLLDMHRAKHFVTSLQRILGSQKKSFVRLTWHARPSLKVSSTFPPESENMTCQSWWLQDQKVALDQQNAGKIGKTNQSRENITMLPRAKIVEKSMTLSNAKSRKSLRKPRKTNSNNDKSVIDFRAAEIRVKPMGKMRLRAPTGGWSASHKFDAF